MSPIPLRPGGHPGRGPRVRGRPSRLSRLAAVPLALVLAATGAAAPGAAATAQDGPGGAAAPWAPSGAEPVTVTLLTGDRVTVHPGTGGTPRVDVAPAPRPGGFVPQFHITSSGGDLRVTPSDTARLVPRQIDPALFNVTVLVEAGLDDASSETIPVIMTHPDGPAPLTTPDLPAARDTRPLPTVGATAAALDKSRAADVVAALSGAATGDTGAGTRAGDGLLPGVEKIWWDRPMEVALDESTAQITVDAARAAGLDGDGVTVAVLDTGVDESHPDLAGRVDASARFVPGDGGTQDGHGHGTHVASTVAGNGAASDGRYEGVAPGVSLLNGKVLNNHGGGLTSSVIAGMQWAAASDADIINLSLGSSHTNPVMIDAVEQLTAVHDTLFAVAAGNDGCELCIGSPGDAPSALTVGAVDGEGSLAEFSNRGPTQETRLLKPELTAPGVGITAARSALAPDGEGSYQDMDGTSMATPHVAGAAALLAQAYPDLNGQELRGALISTAVPADDLTLYEQGAGRVDMARLLDAPVLATSGPVNLGMVPYPQEENAPGLRTVSYRNLSDEAVTLDLSSQVADAQGDPVDGVVTTDPSQLTVPAGENAEAEVTVDVTAVGAGQFGGYVVAEPAEGSVLRTPVGFFNQREHVEMTFEGVTRDGRAVQGFRPQVVNVETGEWQFEYCPADDGHYCLRVPVGTYAVIGAVATPARWHEGPPDPLRAPPRHTTLVGDPEVTVDRDVHLAFDARDAVEVTVDTPAHDARANLGGATTLGWHREPENGPAYQYQLANSPGAQLEERFFVQPMDEVTQGGFAASTRWQLAEPRVTLTVAGGEGPELDPYYYRGDLFETNPLLDGGKELPLVHAGDAEPAEVDAADPDGALALVRRSDDTPVAEQVARVADAGAEMVAVYHDEPGINTDPGEFHLPLAVPTVRISHAEGTGLRDLLADGPVTVRAEGEPASPYLYDVVYAERRQVPDQLDYTADPAELARVEREFRSLGGDTPKYLEVASPLLPWQQFSRSFLRDVRDTPRTRIDYHTATPSWSYGLKIPPSGMTQLMLQSPWLELESGERARWAMPAQPLTPGMPVHQPVQRWQDLLAIPLVKLRDGHANIGDLFHLPELDSSVQLWHGDELLFESERGAADGSLYPPVELSPREETYRLDYRFTNDEPWAGLSTRARTQWTFESAHVDAAEDPRVTPLLTLDYDIPLDVTNSSLPPRERRGPPTIEVTPGHAPGADGSAIAGARLWVSFDDGDTWQERPTRGGGPGRGGGDDGTYEFVVPDRGGGDGYASLRVEAWDAEGNRIEQEVIRAYAVGG